VTSSAAQVFAKVLEGRDKLLVAGERESRNRPLPPIQYNRAHDVLNLRLMAAHTGA